MNNNLYQLIRFFHVVRNVLEINGNASPEHATLCNLLLMTTEQLLALRESAYYFADTITTELVNREIFPVDSSLS